jgi:hypothetical protein
MKKLFTLIAFIVMTTINAQAPQGFNYQATVRNSSGQLLLNQTVQVKFNILQNSSTGDIVYSENQTANTDDLGQINLVVGQGTAPTGTFSTINWGGGSYYLGIELNSGSGYVNMGTTQLLSVPYALHAKTAESIVGNSNFTLDLNLPDGFNSNQIITLSGITNYTVPSNQNLYITSWRPVNGIFNFDIDGKNWGGYASMETKPKVEFVLGAGMNLISTGAININGFFTDANVEYICPNLSQGNFIVPINKIFVGCWQGSGGSLFVNGNVIFGIGIVDESSEISGTRPILGYLINK